GAGNLVCEARETARAVAAHFRFAAVAIVITHPEICAVRAFLEQKDPVRANPAMAIADPDDLLEIELNITDPIIDHHEIVSGAVHLGETQHRRTVRLA